MKNASVITGFRLSPLCGLVGMTGTRRHGCAIVGYRSCQFGFSFSNSSIFHARRHFFSCFPQNGKLNICVLLEIEQPMNPVLLCEAVNEAHSVFVYPAHEIVRHADIERAAKSVCKDVDSVAMLSAHSDRPAFTGSSAFGDDDNNR
jgi:hypothetical protein